MSDQPAPVPPRTTPTRAASYDEERAVRDTPATVEQAEREMFTLNVEINLIQSHLGDRNRLDEQGRRMDYLAWTDWRRKATTAWRFKVARYRWLKQWVRDRRNEEHARTHPAPGAGQPLPPGKEKELLRMAGGAIRVLAQVVEQAQRGVLPTERQRQVSASLTAWLAGYLAQLALADALDGDEPDSPAD